MYELEGPISELLGQPVRGNAINAMFHCPFHEDRTPSFSIHLEEGVWHCFSCQDSGTLKGLYRRLGEDVSPDIRIIQAKRNAEAPIIGGHNFAAQANGCIRDLRREDGQEGYVFLRDFLADRGISEATASHFGIGYDRVKDALSFPYADLEGRVSGIKYRHRNGFKTSETGSNYGLYGVADAVGKEKVIVCEGESDTLSVWSQYTDKGFGVCGTSGASVSEAQWSRFGIHLLFARRVYLLYDADEPGDKCSETAMRLLGDDKCVRIRPTRGKDANEHLLAGGTLEEIGLGE